MVNDPLFMIARSPQDNEIRLEVWLKNPQATGARASPKPNPTDPKPTCPNHPDAGRRPPLGICLPLSDLASFSAFRQLIQEETAIGREAPDLLPVGPCGLRALPVLRYGSPNLFTALRRSGARAESTVQSAPAVLHSRTLARRVSPRLRSTPRGLEKVSRDVTVTQPAASLFMGCIAGFSHPPPFIFAVTGPTMAWPSESPR